MARNCQDIVERLKGEYPAEWAAAHRGGPDTEAFVRRLAWVLHSTVDANFGLLGQRGDASRIADDAILYSGEGTGVDPTTGKNHHGYDFIVGAGGPDPRPGWQRLDDGGVAVWVQPAPVGGSVEPAPVSGVWTAAHQAVVDAMPGADVQAIAEQLAYRFPDAAWGRKRSGAGRPLSGDTVARRLEDGRLYGVRVRPSVRLWGVLDAAQVFESVAPVDHLGDGPADPPPVDPIDPPVDPAPVVTDPALLVLLAEMLAEVVAARTAAQDAATAASAAHSVALEVKAQKYDVTANAGWLGKVSGTITPRAED